MKAIRLGIIGVGPHAKRVYVPNVARLAGEFGVTVTFAVDLKSKEADVRTYFAERGLQPDLIFVEPFGGPLPACVAEQLNQRVAAGPVDGVIISTEPMSHRAYAEWALGQHLHILMDKPISTRCHVVSDERQAAGLVGDYEVLRDSYERLQRTRPTVFNINVQRRYHPGFRLVRELLLEIALKTNCPVTSVQSMHCDGQWRLPGEIVTQEYHPYNSGYGKASHSGYHLFDAAYGFYKAGAVPEKWAQAAEVFSSLLQPRGFLQQLTEADYERYFGADYKAVKQYSDCELRQLYSGYGEMDAFSNIRLLQAGDTVCNISINLLHNGFGRRTWVRPGADLYKGNGRVKHEYHNIQQGPFQNLQVHSYQSSDRHETNTACDYEVGGNNHFDIYVFRNAGMTGDRRALEIIHMGDLSRLNGYHESRLVSEEAKESVVREFLELIEGRRPAAQSVSNIRDHAFPVRLMSAIYSSHIRQQSGADPIVKFEFGEL